jgi:hypothetical protein
MPSYTIKVPNNDDGEDLQPLLGPRPIATTPLWLALSGEVRAEFSVRSR